MNKRTETELIEKYRNAVNKLILLDYDGTLVDYTPSPDDALPSDDIQGVLTKLAEKSGSKVIIISGREPEEIERFLGHLPVEIIASHGAIINENGAWSNQITDNCLWKSSVIPIFENMILMCPETFIENKLFSLAWHYRNSRSDKVYSHSRELIESLKKIGQAYNLKILDGNHIVEIMSSEIGKGNAVKKLLEKQDYDYILSIGDDVTDEEIFDLLLTEPNAFTVKVGNNNTSAKYTISNTSGVSMFLKHLSE